MDTTDLLFGGREPPSNLGFGRLLEENDDSDTVKDSDSSILRNTLTVYGGIFVILFTIFCYVRRRFPKAYNIRSWHEDWKTPLADDQHGFISWIWKMFLISDTTIMDECGMDALCFIRVLQLGFKISTFGMLNALWVIPVYATAREDDATDHISDFVVEWSTAHLPPGSPRFAATALAAYMIFGYTMFCILQEFNWFLSFRHRFLSKPLPRNYAIYIQCIPKEYRTNAKLLKFFRDSICQDTVLDANIVIKTPNLKKKVAQRETVVSKLEHAINIEEFTGVAPTSRSNGVIGHKVNVIDELYEELNQLNDDISESITKIEQSDDANPLSQNNTTPAYTFSGSPRMSKSLLSGSVSIEDDASNGGDVSLLTTDDHSLSKPKSKSNVTYSLGNTPSIEEEEGGFTLNMKALSSFPLKGIKDVAGAATGVATGAVSGVANVLMSAEDGEPESAAFITFKDLRSTQAALQMLHYPRPFAMEALEAPTPEDVFWENTGKTHKELQLGKLLSFSLTSALCLFWTIPMSFISTLSTVEGLRKEVGFVDDMLNFSPWLVPVFEQLAPLLIVVANEVLKMILEYLSMFEGPVSGAVVQASLFSKLAAFMIIQTFFVSAVSGSLFTAISELLDDPLGKGIELLGTALPTQSTFFVQILLVDTFINMALEILRVVPIAMSFARKYVGPRLTEKERNTTWFGIRPLSDPYEFEHADVLAGSVLYFMVLFVYGPIAPFVTVFLSGCFLLMNASYRHQFVYIYPTFPDSGGRLYINIIGLIPSCLLIAEVTIVGLFTLKESPIYVTLMIPLIVITVIFRIYINQKHFETALFLPSHDAMTVDLNSPKQMDFEFVEGKYVQPELREKKAYPENGSIEREINNGGEVYGTPNHSEVDENEDAERELQFGAFAT